MSNATSQGAFSPIAAAARSTTRSMGGVFAAMLLFAAMIIKTFDFVHATEGASFGVDFQTIIRLAACAAFGLYGILHLPVTKHEFFRFPGAWATIILAWAAVTTLFSISVMYSLAAVFALACVTLFVP